jgi:hypothetical protein
VGDAVRERDGAGDGLAGLDAEGDAEAGALRVAREDGSGVTAVTAGAMASDVTGAATAGVFWWPGAGDGERET